jgi:hypothetical protein
VSRPQHGTGGLNTVVSSGLLNELRFGFSRLTSQGSNLPLLNPVDYGINYVRPQNAIGGLGLPDIEINGISGIGNTVQGPSIGIYQEYELSDVLTAVKGRHNMRIGGTYRPGSEDIDNGFFVVGRYVFNGTYTGDTVADFLLGKASEFDYGQGRTRWSWSTRTGARSSRTTGSFATISRSTSASGTTTSARSPTSWDRPRRSSSINRRPGRRRAAKPR